MKFLVVESETAAQREARRKSAGRSAGETFQATLEQLVPSVEVTRITPADQDVLPMTADTIAGFDAVFVGGSPLHAYEDKPEVHRLVALMRQVFAAGTPAFGSCQGLHLGVVAAGGRVRPMAAAMEAPVSRRITPTETGRTHPLLAGRAPAWDAGVIHNDEVEVLPDGALLLATNSAAAVQATAFRHDKGWFWGVQYHPELSPGELAQALRREAADVVKKGLAKDEAVVKRRAQLLECIQKDPDDRAARWELGVDDEFAHEDRRRVELTNFIDSLPALRA